MLARATLLGGTAATLFLAPVVQDALKRGAAEGETRTRTMETVRKMSLVDMVIRMNGEEIPAEMMGEMDQTTIEVFSGVIVDEFEAAEGGRATRILRTYEALAGESSMEGAMLEQAGQGAMTSDLESELTGEKVIFVWDGEAEEYTPRLPEDSTLDEDLLEDLEGDLELAGLLPRGAVEVGGEWEIELDVFERVLEPGGQLHLEPEDSDMADMSEVQQQIEDADVDPIYDGAFTGKLVGFEEVEGARLATIELTFDLEMTMDLSGVLDPFMQDSPMGEIEITPLEIIIDRTAEGSGTLVWNVTDGRLASLVIDAELTENMTNNVEVDVGQVMEQYQEVMLEGTLELSYTID